MNKTMLVLGVAALGAGLLVAGVRRGDDRPSPPAREGPAQRRSPVPADRATSDAGGGPRNEGRVRPAPPDRAEPLRAVSVDGPRRDLEDAIRSRRAERVFWEDMSVLLELKDREAARREAMTRAARYLELDAARAAAFEAATARAVEEVAEAWREREGSWGTAVANIGLDPAHQERLERDIHERYESRKRAALSGLAAQLPAEGPSARFRERLEEWIDVLR